MSLVSVRIFSFHVGLPRSICRWRKSKNIVRSNGSLEYNRSLFIRAHPLDPELPSAIKYFFKFSSYQIECFSEAMGLHRTLDLNSNLLQPLRWCCVDCVIHHERDVREEQKYVCVEGASNSKRDCEHDLYCCLLPRCEALRICRSGFPIATKWCCDQGVKVVPRSAFTQRRRDRCGSLQKGGDVVATSSVVLRWLCDSPRTRCAWRQKYVCVERASNNKRDCDVVALLIWTCERLNVTTSVRKERLRRMISIVACCRGAKLCAHAARDIRSQQIQWTVPIRE